MAKSRRPNGKGFFKLPGGIKGPFFGKIKKFARKILISQNNPPKNPLTKWVIRGIMYTVRQT